MVLSKYPARRPRTLKYGIHAPNKNGGNDVPLFGLPKLTADTVFPWLEVRLPQWEEIGPAAPLEEVRNRPDLAEKHRAALTNFAPEVEARMMRNPKTGEADLYTRIVDRPWVTTGALLTDPDDGQLFLTLTGERKDCATPGNGIVIVPPSGTPTNREWRNSPTVDTLYEVAKREFLRETGLPVSRIHPLNLVLRMVSSRRQTTRYWMALVTVGEDASAIAPVLKEDEMREVFLMSIDECWKLIEYGQGVEGCFADFLALSERFLLGRRTVHP